MLGESYRSVEMQSAYSAVPVHWAIKLREHANEN